MMIAWKTLFGVCIGIISVMLTHVYFSQNNAANIESTMVGLISCAHALLLGEINATLEIEQAVARQIT
jgi:hypothetical protein